MATTRTNHALISVVNTDTSVDIIYPKSTSDDIIATTASSLSDKETVSGALSYLDTQVDSLSSTSSSHGSSISILNGSVTSLSTNYTNLSSSVGSHISNTATGSIKGHVKLSDSVTDGSSGVSSGVAATPFAVNNLATRISALEAITPYSGTADMTAGSSTLTTNRIYCVYE